MTITKGTFSFSKNNLSWKKPGERDGKNSTLSEECCSGCINSSLAYLDMDLLERHMEKTLPINGCYNLNVDRAMFFEQGP